MRIFGDSGGRSDARDSIGMMRVSCQLVGDGDVARGLRDPHVGVVDRRDHRVGKAAAVDDAADAEAVLVVRVARFAAEQAAAPLHGNRRGRRRARRKPTVGRIDHQRSAPRRRVVFAPVRNRGVRAPHGAGQDVHGLEVLLIANADVLHALRVLLVGQERPRAVLRGPLERHAVFTFGRPVATEIGVAPRRTRAPRGVVSGLRTGRVSGSQQVHRYRDGEHSGGDRSSRPRCHRLILRSGCAARAGVVPVLTRFCRASTA